MIMMRDAVGRESSCIAIGVTSIFFWGGPGLISPPLTLFLFFLYVEEIFIYIHVLQHSFAYIFI